MLPQRVGRTMAERQTVTYGSRVVRISHGWAGESFLEKMTSGNKRLNSEGVVKGSEIKSLAQCQAHSKSQNSTGYYYCYKQYCCCCYGIY